MQNRVQVLCLYDTYAGVVVRTQSPQRRVRVRLYQCGITPPLRHAQGGPAAARAVWGQN